MTAINYSAGAQGAVSSLTTPPRRERSVDAQPANGTRSAAAVPDGHAAVQAPRTKSVEEAAKDAAKALKKPDLDSAQAETKASMEAASQQIQGYLRDSGRNLDVFVDESTGYYVAKVVNPTTGEVVRSLPSEETLRIARSIDMMRGALVNQRA
jgi:flagellar protein FlaG